ncbi:hypothetical protein A9Q83_18240 [Alphaproteobacteria bacterium 46_93_T64]|nr:hypothetical protein A9Q83_18240 [Alphaproteobacteria bacterium 46_93_T64]
MFSEIEPSPRYRQLLELYKLMHGHGVSRRSGNEVIDVAAHNTFLGRGIFRHINSIRTLIQVSGSISILDYGSGKGVQYTDDVLRNGKKVSNSLHEYWKVQDVACFDPGISDEDDALDKKYDGVIATNVLDLIPEEDLKWVVERLFSRANKFVFCNVADFPSPTSLPSGENARVTKRSSLWWRALFAEANKKHPEINYCIAFGTRRKKSDGEIVENTGYLHNCQDLSMPGEKYASPVGKDPKEKSVTAREDD